MTLRRSLSLLALLVLVLSPFGRMAAAEAMAPAQPPAAVIQGHCDDGAAPAHDEGDRSHRASLDCVAACAAMTAAQPATIAIDGPTAWSSQADFAAPEFPGLHPEAEPPPPRLS